MSPRKPKPTSGEVADRPALDSTPVVDLAPVDAAPLAATAPPPPATRIFHISRRRSVDPKPHFDDIEVAVQPGDTVLDALLRIRRTKEPSLVVRHSCMHASCGTCGLRINGRESLACDTKLDAVSPEPTKPGKQARPIKVEPLANQRSVADVATDMVDFQARFEAADMPLVRNAEVAPATETPDGIKAFGRFENCIECGLCLSACPIARTNHDYIGPAALAAAARVVEEPRGHDLGPVLALAAEPDSVWRCRDAMECSAVCPSGVDPALAILTLRRHIASSRTRRFLAGES